MQLQTDFKRRLLLWVLLVGIVLAPVAGAEACGAYIPREGEAGMARERGLVLWDGRTERVLMELSVTGEASEAAWIFPVPAPAVVELGDSAILDELETLTAPRVVVDRRWSFGPMMSAGAPDGAGRGVTVLEQQTLGPFEVTTLAASEATALEDWLKENGYTFPFGLTEVLAPYVERGWFYVAARLTPAGQGESLNGQLDPLWITFEADTPVYTMRPAAMAPAPFPLSVYVLADHRVEKVAASGASRVAYAGFLDSAGLPAGSQVAPLLSGRQFLTRFDDTVIPSLVADDYTFTFAAADTEYQDTVTRLEFVDISGWVGAAALGLCGLVCLGALGLGGAVLLFRRNGRARPAA